MAKFKKLNFTQIPNEILDSLMPVLTGAQFKVIMLISRHTLGFHRDCHAMSIENIVKKTGLSRQGVIDSVEVLETQEFIVKTERRSADTLYCLPSLYSLNIEEEGVVNSVDYPQSTQLTTPSQLVGLPLVNSVDYPIRNKEKNKYNSKEKNFSNSLSSQKNEIQNQQPSSPEDSTLEPDSPPMATAPSQTARLDQDVGGIPIGIEEAKKIVKTRLVNAGVKFKGKDFKFRNNREDLKKFNASLDDYTSEKRLLGALEQFETSTYWYGFDRQVGAFAKLFNESDQYSNPRIDARPPKKAVVKPNGSLPRSDEASTPKRLETPVKAKRWSELFPEKPVTDWTQSSPIADLVKAEADSQFGKNFDEICRRARLCHQSGQIENMSFDWLFEFSKGKVNWYRLSKGLFAWAEKPKSEQAKPKFKSETEAYLDGVRERVEARKKLEKEKLNDNGKDTGEYRPSDSITARVGVPIRATNDAKRTEGLGDEPLGDC